MTEDAAESDADADGATVTSEGGASALHRGVGRPPGSLNKVTAEIKALARQYAPAALEELGRLATGAESEAARIAAIREVLDRGYGKAKAYPPGGDPDEPPMRTKIVVEFI